MRTTLNLDEDVLLAAKERARREGRTLGEVLSELAREALTGRHRRDEPAKPEAFYGFEPLPRCGRGTARGALAGPRAAVDAAPGTGHNSHMTTVGIAELKASLSEYLEKVKAGEEILVTDRGRPVARLVGVADLPAGIERLVRRGVARPPRRALDVERLTAAALPEDPEGSVLAALLEERRTGR